MPQAKKPQAAVSSMATMCIRADLRLFWKCIFVSCVFASSGGMVVEFYHEEHKEHTKFTREGRQRVVELLF